MRRLLAKAFSPPKGEKANSAMIRKAGYATEIKQAYINKMRMEPTEGSMRFLCDEIRLFTGLPHAQQLTGMTSSA